jgi:GT2 family glycosyltransferase
LDACIESINNLDYPRELLDVVLVGRKSYAPTFEGVKTVAPESDEFGNEFGQNFGVEHTDPASELLFLINDDVILTRSCLKNMALAAGNQDCLMVPISPCDNAWKYTLHFQFMHNNQAQVVADRFYRYDDLKPYLKSMMNADSVYNPGLVYTDKLCLFAALIPRSTWNKVGRMDEGFSTGQSDFDYSIRCRHLNIPRAVCLNALAWHFGGATSTDTLSAEKRQKNADYFKKKWPNETLY